MNSTASSQRAGEHYGVKLSAEFTVPWDYPVAQIPWHVYLDKWVAQKLKQGFHFHRVIRTYEDTAAYLSEGKARRLFVIDALFSRAARVVNLDVDDAMALRLIARYPRLFRHGD